MTATFNRGFRYRERLPARASGRTLLAYLSDRYRHSSEDEWRQRIERGLVLVEDEPAETTRPLAAGETLVWNRPPWREPEAPTSFAILHRDGDVLAVAKPAGLPTVPGGGFLENTLLARVRRAAPGASPLHRLGRGTSGIVLFARNPDARRSLTAAWKEGGVERRYRALVKGRVSWEEATLEEPIGPVPHALLGSVSGASPEGKPAKTRAFLVERREGASLVEVVIETGRTHQIRIHLAAAGHPLVGDPLYPVGGVPGRKSEILPGAPGYRLHAHRMRFRHPRSGLEVRVDCGPPSLYRAEWE